jgi:DUF1680 family protein
MEEMPFFRLEGEVGRRFHLNETRWLLIALEENPDMIQIFRTRDSNPKPIMPWFGEFPGKVLTGMAMNYHMSRSDPLLRAGNALVDALAEVQGEDGYLGPHPASRRLTGKIHPDSGGDPANLSPLWDLWGNYHCIYGLVLWYRETGRSDCLQMAIRAADFILRYFQAHGTSYAGVGWAEMNLAIGHAYTTLHLETGEARFLEAAETIVQKEWPHPNAGDWLAAALNDVEFHATQKPRWESLHSIMTLADLYRITGKKEYFQAFEQIWWSILKTDRHNDGGFSSGEGACGNPYDTRAIETCCTIAWMAYSSEYWKLTRNSYLADELELSLLNAHLGSQVDDGGHFTYNTPMMGVRIPSVTQIGAQGTEHGKRLNCCQVNGARGFGQIGLWGADVQDTSIYLNYYGASRIALLTPAGHRLTLSQRTKYPSDGSVRIAVGLDSSESFALNLRIPFWSVETTLLVNGERIEGITAGQYAAVRREWRDGDVMQLTLDMSPHIWVGEREMKDRVSIFTGPILLTSDLELSGSVSQEVLNPGSLERIKVLPPSREQILVEAQMTMPSGQVTRLFDFASSGQTGKEYSSWLPCTGFTPTEFSRNGTPVWGCKPRPASHENEVT